ncbi:hypothetical protein RsoM2USA_457 [Ralstonia phage RsoM2USA]|nr:hypothetical protein RsoM2USA_457 [Ralstonia phage RsoM2USA]
MGSTVTPKYLTKEQIRSLLKTSKAWNLEALRFLVDDDGMTSHERFVSIYHLYLSHKKHGDLPADLLKVLQTIILDPKINDFLVKIAHDRLSKYKSGFDGISTTDTLRGETTNPHEKTTLDAFEAMVAQAEKLKSK